MSEQLICKNVTLGYEGRAVTEGLHFTVSSGDYLCILGENGSGKSTLVKALLGLITPMEGEIVRGEDIAGGVGYLPQQTVVQRDFPASVREIVRSGCLKRSGLRPFYNKQEKALADENMERLGISHLANRCYRELSGGQQQRVLLARALCATSKILLLDEPVTGLDPRAQTELYELIGELNRGGVTMIMVSHDVSAIKYATHILHIGSKEQLFFGTREDYLSSRIGKSFVITESGEGAVPASDTDTDEKRGEGNV
ncbi:MAG: metal ABC transporter ATP-binding protein [Ruminococcus sp.]|nr:metal ABC transporter ATP-binding protein [Ruminococcus sp.]